MFLALSCRSTDVFSLSVHRFSHGTMPWYNIVKKSVSSVIHDSRKRSLLTIVSSTHYHVLSGKFIILHFRPFLFLVIHLFCSPGVFLALDIYRSKFSATSPYIVNTIRDNEQFLWICTGVWAVSCLFFFSILFHIIQLHPVCRNFEFAHSSYPPILET